MTVHEPFDDDAIDPQEDHPNPILCKACWGMLGPDEKCLLCENKRLEQWVNDLLAGKNINCVYCGFNFGPDEVTAATMHEQLYEHIKVCEKHPLAAALGLLEYILNHCLVDEEGNLPDDAMIEDAVEMVGEAKIRGRKPS